MPPLQKNKKIKQANQIDTLLLPVTWMVFSRKPISKEKPEESTIDFHLEIINKIDKLLKEHESETFSLDSITEQQTCNSPEEPPIEVRDPLSKKIGLSEVKLGMKPDDIFTNRETIPEEFKTDLSVINNPNFKFVTTLDFKEDIPQMKETENERIEIIDLGSLSIGDVTPQKISILILNENHGVKHQTNNSSKNRLDSDKILSKKIEIIDTKELGNKKCNKVFSKMIQQPKEKERKAQVYYLDSGKRQKESRFKGSESERLHIPENFEDKLKELEEKEEDIKRKKKELKEKEKEAEKLKELEAKKAMIEAKEKEKAAKKARRENEAKLKRREKEQREKEMEEEKKEKLKRQEIGLREKQREEQRLKKIEAKKTVIAAREKEKAAKKAEKEKLAELKRQEMEQRAKEKEAKKSKKITITSKKHKKGLEVKNPLFFFKKEKKRGHKKKLNWGMKKKKDKKQEPTLLDEDIKKLLVITDNLLGELPEEVIDKFAQSKDFELYSKVLSKYKIK